MRRREIKKVMNLSLWQNEKNLGLWQIFLANTTVTQCIIKMGSDCMRSTNQPETKKSDIKMYILMKRKKTFLLVLIHIYI